MHLIMEWPWDQAQGHLFKVTFIWYNCFTYVQHQHMTETNTG